MSRHVLRHLCFANKNLAVHVQGHFGPQTLWHVVHHGIYLVYSLHESILPSRYMQQQIVLTVALIQAK